MLGPLGLPAPTTSANDNNATTNANTQNRLSHVANNTALAAWANTAFPVERDGFATAGDGGRARYTWSSTACTAADGGSQITATAGGCWNIAKNELLNDQMFGADCTNTNDSTAAVQAMWTAAANLQMTIKHRACVAKLTSPITVAGFVNSEGMRPQLVKSNAGSGTANTIGNGAWYHLAHTGKGFIFTPAKGNTYPYLEYGQNVRGFGTYRDQPTPSSTAGTAFTPCACDFDLTFSFAGANVDVPTLNPTKAIYLDNGGKTNIEHFEGSHYKSASTPRATTTS